MVPPGRRSPSFSACSIIAMAIRSLTEPPGLSISILATRFPGGWNRERRTRGVPPIRSITESWITEPTISPPCEAWARHPDRCRVFRFPVAVPYSRTDMLPRSLTRYAWFVLVFNVVVILLGAVVRATGSGAGCGRSWPGCHGTFVPPLEGDTAIEYSHRAVSGVALVLVLVLVVLVWRVTQKGHPARLGAGLSMIAIVGEALIGAMIVLAEWVAHDDSTARVVAVPLHLVNTLFLLAVLTLTAFWIGGGPRLRWSEAASTIRRWVTGAGIGLVALAATGAVTALADTLFPKGGDLSDRKSVV